MEKFLYTQVRKCIIFQKKGDTLFGKNYPVVPHGTDHYWPKTTPTPLNFLVIFNFRSVKHLNVKLLISCCLFVSCFVFRNKIIKKLLLSYENFWKRQTASKPCIGFSLAHMTSWKKGKRGFTWFLETTHFETLCINKTISHFNNHF